jgi:hypothetical protein
MQEKYGTSPESESIDEILESIKGLVYPSVIDLNRPLREDLGEDAMHVNPHNYKSASSLKEPPFSEDASAVQALSSFMHTVREKKEDMIVHEKKEEEKASCEMKRNSLPVQETSLEHFLTDVVNNALTPHIRSVLEREMQTFLQNEGKNCMEPLVEKWFEGQGKDIVRLWLEKHAPALVVRCVEVYLQKLSQAAY